MNYLNKHYKGFSLVEILTATTVLLIVMGAAYATFLSVARLSTAGRNDLEAHTEASRWLEEVRAMYEYDNLTTTASPVDLNNASSILQENYKSDWPFATNPNVQNLNAEYSVVENLDFGSHLHFKKVTIRVRWQEKKTS